MSEDPNDPGGCVQSAIGVVFLMGIGAFIAVVAVILRVLHAHGWL